MVNIEDWLCGCIIRCHMSFTSFTHSHWWQRLPCKVPSCSSGANLTQLTPLGAVWSSVACLRPTCNMQTGGVGDWTAWDWTAGLPISGWPALPPEPQLPPYILCPITRMKRGGAELSTDHYLVVNWIRWKERLLGRPSKPKHVVWVNWEHRGRRALYARSLTPTSGKMFMHPKGGLGHGIRVGHVQSLHCGSGCSELWSEGCQCLLWQHRQWRRLSALAAGVTDSWTTLFSLLPPQPGPG